MTITTRLYTLFHGHLVGEDPFGNRYYTEKKAPEGRRQKRWVMYNGAAEPSKVPAEWHGWLQYTIAWPPTQRSIRRYPWQKPHQPNLTGTKGAYVPPGHLLAGAQREPTTADYEAWKP
jgi:NADH:ubiquinone oxidoreductase subunit